MHDFNHSPGWRVISSRVENAEHLSQSLALLYGERTNKPFILRALVGTQRKSQTSRMLSRVAYLPEAGPPWSCSPGTTQGSRGSAPPYTDLHHLCSSHKAFIQSLGFLYTTTFMDLPTFSKYCPELHYPAYALVCGYCELSCVLSVNTNQIYKMWYEKRSVKYIITDFWIDYILKW